MTAELPTNQVIQGDCLDILPQLPEKSVDVIFADPPYNLQLQNQLWRPNLTQVDAVDDAWDHFSSFDAYDEFCWKWLAACQRVLKDNGSLWLIGSYHNIFRLGRIMQDLGYWILNDVVWVKTNPMPNFRGVRFTNAHETLIWASKFKGSRYTFNHHAMKSMNEDKQMRSDWFIPICSGAERLKINGKKAHPTQKPEALIYRVLLATSNPGDVVLDPFFGTGTTGAVAKKLHRDFIGIEREDMYVKLARERIQGVTPGMFDDSTFEVRDRRKLQPRVPFSCLLEQGFLKPGQSLFFRPDISQVAHIKPDGNLALNGLTGSIHGVGKVLMSGAPCNGWDNWYYEHDDGSLGLIDELRQEYIAAGQTPVENTDQN